MITIEIEIKEFAVSPGKISGCINARQEGYEDGTVEEKEIADALIRKIKDIAFEISQKPGAMVNIIDKKWTKDI